MQAEDLGDPESILICLHIELNDPKMMQEEFFISLQQTIFRMDGFPEEELETVDWLCLRGGDAFLA